jgi:hemerythrin superfamily protein
VHRLIRRDLQTVRALAADLGSGLPGDDALAVVRTLEVAGPLWQLRINCLQYCRFVHAHHHAESALLFPRLRRSNRALAPVVDKLEADHAEVAELLDEVSAAASDLASQESVSQESVSQESVSQESVSQESVSQESVTRARLMDALGALSAVLLEHLDYEEEHIADTLRTWGGWGW